MKILTISLLFLSSLAATPLARAKGREILFFEEKTLKITIEAPFGGKELSPGPESMDSIAKSFEKKEPVMGRLTLHQTVGQKVYLDIQLKLRGHDRAMSCQFPPLKLSFAKADKKTLDNSDFKNIKGIKLVTHCDRYPNLNPEDDELKVSANAIHQEYFAYKLYQNLTNQSFGVRMAEITYIDTLKKIKTQTRFAFFIEPDNNLAKRIDLKLASEDDDFKKLNDLIQNKMVVNQLNLFESLLGNYDFKTDPQALQNVVAFFESEKQLTFVPYDFDRSRSFMIPDFDPWNGFKSKSVEKNKNPIVQAFKCLNARQQVGLIHQFEKLAAQAIQEVKNHPIFNLVEKQNMTLYYSGFLVWLKTLPTIAEKAECRII